MGRCVCRCNADKTTPERLGEQEYKSRGGRSSSKRSFASFLGAVILRQGLKSLTRWIFSLPARRYQQQSRADKVVAKPTPTGQFLFRMYGTDLVKAGNGNSTSARCKAGEARRKNERKRKAAYIVHRPMPSRHSKPAPRAAVSI